MHADFPFLCSPFEPTKPRYIMTYVALGEWMGGVTVAHWPSSSRRQGRLRTPTTEGTNSPSASLRANVFFVLELVPSAVLGGLSCSLSTESGWQAVLSKKKMMAA